MEMTTPIVLNLDLSIEDYFLLMNQKNFIEVTDGEFHLSERVIVRECIVMGKLFSFTGKTSIWKITSVLRGERFQIEKGKCLLGVLLLKIEF